MESNNEKGKSRAVRNVRDSISGLSVAELNELVEALKDQFGITPTSVTARQPGSDTTLAFIQPSGTLPRLSPEEERDIEKTFRELVSQWKDETAHLSTTDRKYTHPSYLKIISMGESALPLLLREMQENPSHWFYALATIKGGEDPAKSAKGFDEAVELWLNWGREKGYIGETSQPH